MWSIIRLISDMLVKHFESKWTFSLWSLCFCSLSATCRSEASLQTEVEVPAVCAAALTVSATFSLYVMSCFHPFLISIYFTVSEKLSSINHGYVYIYIYRVFITFYFLYFDLLKFKLKIFFFLKSVYLNLYRSAQT